MVLQLKNYRYLWQRSLTFTLSLLGFRNCRISFGLWFRLIRDELIEAHQDSKDVTLNNVVYTPLSNSGIRVLILEPGSWADPLKASLKEKNLQDTMTPYEALSYAWGTFSLSSNKGIRIQDSIMPITSNLDEALRSLRSEQSQRVIWVDFVCINQSNLQERVHQVRMMGDIYRQAEKVIVWLGMPTFASELGMKTLTFFAGNEDLTKGSPWEADAPKNIVAAINDIFERPYFERIWVVQEGALARKTDLCVGQLIVSWDQGSATSKFLSRLKFVQISPTWEYSGLRGVRLEPLIDMLTISHLALARARGFEVRATIIDVLHDMRHRESTDPRDMIFALLGLGLETYGVMADYEISREETYRRLFEGLNQAAQQEMNELDATSPSSM
ncbi:heterokaryon incompatibility protein-domain-containing protein [Xylariales sp. AK1849]|nr:heterokaryon incompatibility protein-domain-containing protein [Xylariales sp. AK1849]